MPFASSAGILAVAFLTTTTGASEHPPIPSCEAGDLHLELEADAPAKAPMLCITPELSTNLFFDSKLARVELEGRGQFRRAVEAADSLTLVPSESMRGMEPRRVTVYFQDGAAPASATFLLVVHPAQAARQVDILRHTRPVAFYRQEARESQVKLQRCEEEKGQMLAEQSGPGGLRGLREAGIMDERSGVAITDISLVAKARPNNALEQTNTVAYHSKNRLAVEVWLKNPGPMPWTLAGALLQGPNGEELVPLPLGRPVSILPEKEGQLMVEFDAAKWQDGGRYTLTLWDADRRSVILENVKFP